MTTGDRSVPTHTHSTTHGQMPGSRYSRRLHRESLALRGMVAHTLHDIVYFFCPSRPLGAIFLAKTCPVTMKAVLSRLAANTGSALWDGTARVTDSGGGATDVIVVRYSSAPCLRWHCSPKPECLRVRSHLTHCALTPACACAHTGMPTASSCVRHFTHSCHASTSTKISWARASSSL